MTSYESEIEESDRIEWKIIHHESFFEHLQMKRLVIDNFIPFPIGTFNRMVKYIKYGFNPCTETKIKLLIKIHELKGITDEELRLFGSADLYEGWD